VLFLVNEMQAIQAAAKKDPLYVVYKQRVYNGRTTVEELLGTASAATATSFGTVSHTADAAFHPSDTTSGDATSSSCAPELSVWSASPLWEVGSGQYPVTADKLCVNVGVISSIAAIAHGCDWLVNQLSRYCAALHRIVTVACSSVLLFFSVSNDLGLSLCAFVSKLKTILCRMCFYRFVGRSCATTLRKLAQSAGKNTSSGDSDAFQAHQQGTPVPADLFHDILLHLHLAARNYLEC
jgi:hypothetical protein